jgi:hypothetical protein
VWSSAWSRVARAVAGNRLTGCPRVVSAQFREVDVSGRTRRNGGLRVGSAPDLDEQVLPRAVPVFESDGQRVGLVVVVLSSLICPRDDLVDILGAEVPKFNAPGRFLGRDVRTRRRCLLAPEANPVEVCPSLRRMYLARVEELDCHSPEGNWVVRNRDRVSPRAGGGNPFRPPIQVILRTPVSATFSS